MSLSYSVIICSIDAGKFAQASLCYQRLLAGRSFEIIGIHDAHSLCEGYQRGAAQSLGECLIFSHDDILIIDTRFAEKIETRLQEADLLGFAGTTRLCDGYWWASGAAHLRGAVAHAAPGHAALSLFVYGVGEALVEPVQAVDGLCMIVKREAWVATPFDADTFDGFHLYDLDFSLRAHLAGWRVAVMHDIAIIHMSSGNFDERWQLYRQRFVHKHATQLAWQESDSLPQMIAMPARAADFAELGSLLQCWTHNYLKRASLVATPSQTFLEHSRP